MRVIPVQMVQLALRASVDLQVLRETKGLKDR